MQMKWCNELCSLLRWVPREHLSSTEKVFRAILVISISVKVISASLSDITIYDDSRPNDVF